MSQNSNVQTQNNNSVSPNNQFAAMKADLALYGSPVQIRPNKNIRRVNSLTKLISDYHQDDSQQSGLSSGLSRSDAPRGVPPEEPKNEENRHRPLTRSDARRGSSFIKMMSEELHSDDSHHHLGGPRLIRSDATRRGSSVLKAMSEDSNIEDLPSSRRPSRADLRRGSSFVKMMIEEEQNGEEILTPGRLSRNPEIRCTSEDNEDMSSRRSSKSDVRRGSSFIRMISEENDTDDTLTWSKSTDRSEVSDKARKSLDNTYKHSLESISEYKTKTFSSASYYPCNDYTSMESPTWADLSRDLSSEYAVRSGTESAKDTDRTYANSSLNYLSWIESVNSDHFGNNITHVTDNDNRYGEWNSFWSNYSSSRNQYFSSPYLCPSNSGEDLSFESNGSTQRGYTDKSSADHVVLTGEEVNEALHCTQRLLDILRGAVKRAENDITFSKHDSEAHNNSFKDEKPKSENDSHKEKSFLKTTNNSCIDVILNHTGVADILKRVINKRRDVIMPPEEVSSASESKASGSNWSMSKK